jgi:hypothetical protein
MTMVAKIGMAAAVALVASLGFSNASFAAQKKHDYSDGTKCLGGGCTAANPDRVGHYESFYKKPKKKHHTASTNS